MMSRVRQLAGLIRERCAIGYRGDVPVGEDEETVVLCPIHTTNHRGIVHDADLDSLEDIVGASEALEPDDTLELDIPLLIELMKGL